MEARADDTVVKSSERPWLRRTAWGAIFAGTFVAFGIQVMLTFLGIAIGLASINPWQEQNPGGLTTGAAVWLVITGIIALFCGGWVAGRLSGEPRSLDRAINALVLWGLTLVLALYMTAATANAILGGALGLFRTGAAAVGAAAPLAGQALGGPDSPVGDIQNQIQQLAQRAADTTPEARQQIADRLGRALNELADQGRLSSQTRQQVSELLARWGGMSQTQADSTIRNWEQRAGRAREQVPPADTLRRMAEDAANRAAQAALLIFFILLLSAAAAVVGGMVAQPGVPEERAVRR